MKPLDLIMAVIFLVIAASTSTSCAMGDPKKRFGAAIPAQIRVTLALIAAFSAYMASSLTWLSIHPRDHAGHATWLFIGLWGVLAVHFLLSAVATWNRRFSGSKSDRGVGL